MAGVLVGLHFQLPDLDGHRNPRVGVAPPFRPTIPLRSIVGLNGGLGLRGSYRQRFTLPGAFKLDLNSDEYVTMLVATIQNLQEIAKRKCSES